MATEIDIINNALTKLGAAPILTLTDSSREARLAQRTYDDLRDDMLRDHEWNWAVRRFSLAASVTVPVWEFDNSYVLPSDFLRLVEIYNPSANDYRIERTADGVVIVTDIDAPLKGRYVARIENANEMDPKFREALSARLALEWAEPITASDSLTAKLAAFYRQKLADAKTVDGQEDFTSRGDADWWVDARY